MGLSPLLGNFDTYSNHIFQSENGREISEVEGVVNEAIIGDNISIYNSVRLFRRFAFGLGFNYNRIPADVGAVKSNISTNITRRYISIMAEVSYYLYEANQKPLNISFHLFPGISLNSQEIQINNNGQTIYQLINFTPSHFLLAPSIRLNIRTNPFSFLFIEYRHQFLISSVFFSHAQINLGVEYAVQVPIFKEKKIQKSQLNLNKDILKKDDKK